MAQPKINYIEFPFILPSIHLIRCPRCGSSQIEIVGVKGVAGKAMGNFAAIYAGGIIGSVIYDAVQEAKEAKNTTLPPIRFHCLGCSEKFEAVPHGSEKTDVLEAPYTITFTRKGVFGDDQYYMFLNGLPVAVVPTLTNTFSFPTNVKRNTLFLLNPLGKPVKNGIYEFNATSGGNINLLYAKRQFSVL